MTKPPWEQTHIDLGALSQRVTGMEDKFVSLSDQLSSFATNVGNQMNSLAAKIDQQQSAYAAGRTTNWSTIIASGVGLLTITGGFFFSQMRPYDNDLSRHDREITHLMGAALQKDDFRNYAAETNAWISSLRDRLRADEDKAVDQRQVGELKERLDERYHITEEHNKNDFARIEARVGTVDGQLVKRPEIEALLADLKDQISALSGAMNERVTAISLRMNEAAKSNPALR